jgi:hypothetical protein
MQPGFLRKNRVNSIFCNLDLSYEEQKTKYHNIEMAAALRRKYKGVQVNFFRYLHGNQEYDRNHEFSREELDAVTHNDVLNYFKVQCFGNVEPDYDNQIVQYRVETVEFWKKALSWFFQRFGLENKTRHQQITKFLSIIRKMECRGLGQPSHDVRPIQHNEFVFLLRKLKEDRPRASIIHKFGLPAMLCYQFAMISRIDDATQLTVANIQRHDKFPTIALQSKLTWSKNVHEQRGTPWQSLLGSLETGFCVLVNLGLWLEVFLSTTAGAHLSPYVFSFSNDNNIPAGGNKSKQKASNIFHGIFADDFFGDGNLGSHSIRKFAATHCRNNGMSTDDVNVRGRWKRSGVSDRYMDPNLPYVDIKACFSLCQGGMCTYVPKPDCLTDDFVCTYAAPNIVRKYNREVAIVLGHAITWVTFSSHADMVPENLRDQIIRAYNLLPQRLPQGENPIARKKIRISGDVNRFRLAAIDDAIDENIQNEHGLQVLADDNDAVGGLQNIAAMFTVQHNDILRTVNDSSRSAHDQIETLTASVNAVVNSLTTLQRTITESFARLNRQPHRMLQAAVAANADPPQVPVRAQRNVPVAAIARPIQPLPAAVAMNASLSSTPASLNDLWVEWQFGIGGRKPARLFTERESGVAQLKSTFSRRKVFWEVMEYLIRTGHTHDGACIRIYQVYGENRSITYILKQMALHRKHNTSPLMVYR